MIDDRTALLLEQFEKVRQKTVKLVRSIPADRVAIVPDGLRNHIHWQAGHLVAVHASLLYRRIGRPLPVDDEYLSFFGKGTAPSQWSGEPPAFDKTLDDLELLHARLRSDLPHMIDCMYSEALNVSTVDMTLTSFVDALAFLSLHEVYHLGMIIAMKNLIEK